MDEYSGIRWQGSRQVLPPLDRGAAAMSRLLTGTDWYGLARPDLARGADGERIRIVLTE